MDDSTPNQQPNTHASDGSAAVGNIQIGDNYYGSAPLSPRDANLNILLANVRQIWVEDYLNSALLPAIYIDLGLRLKQDAVPQPFAELNIRLRPSGEDEQDLPPDTTIYDVYRQAQESLLILGMPGAGKTTTLANLTRDLIIRAEANETAPILVIFNLSSCWTLYILR